MSAVAVRPVDAAGKPAKKRAGKWDGLKRGSMVSVYTGDGGLFHAVIDDIDDQRRFLWIRPRGMQGRRLIHHRDQVRVLSLAS